MSAVLSKFAKHVLLDPAQRQRSPTVARKQSVAVETCDRLPREFDCPGIVSQDRLDRDSLPACCGAGR